MRVITPASVEPVSLDTLRMQCRIDDASEDELLSIYLSSARESAEAYLGFAVAPTLVESAYTTFPTGSIPLEAAPVLSVESIKYLDADGDAQTVAVDGYELDGHAGTVTPGVAWPAGATAVLVRYVIGYSDGDGVPLPRSILAAILLTAAHLYRNREDTTAETLQTLPQGAAHMLRPLSTRMGFA